MADGQQQQEEERRNDWRSRVSDRSNGTKLFLQNKPFLQKLMGNVALGIANTVDATYSFLSNPILGGIGGAAFGALQGVVLGSLAAVAVVTIGGSAAIAAPLAVGTVLGAVAIGTVYHGYKGLVNAFHSAMENDGADIADNLMQGAGVPIRAIQRQLSKAKSMPDFEDKVKSTGDVLDGRDLNAMQEELEFERRLQIDARKHKQHQAHAPQVPHHRVSDEFSESDMPGSGDDDEMDGVSAVAPQGHAERFSWASKMTENRVHSLSDTSPNR